MSLTQQLDVGARAQETRKSPAETSVGPIPIREAAYPFLRWAGGKQQIIAHLLKLLPTNASRRRYCEPFIGAGSMFFALRPSSALLSDANEHLIKCYEHVRTEWRLVAKYLYQHRARTSQSHYYQVRDEYNRSRYSAAQTARFIYLNKTCFNGIFRVNRRNEFNVPYGWKEPPALPDSSALRVASEALRSATLIHCSFETALRDVGRGDFCYLDPPYPPLNATAYFTHYTKSRFNGIDQEWLALKTHELDTRGCVFMMTNADTPRIRRLYRRFRISSIPVIRFVTCKSRRHQARELVIRNF